jgi:hypothetical protein
VVANDLSSIPDLQDKHRRVLAETLKITTFRALAHADRRDIQRAMSNLRPRPTLEQIARWQDHARSRLSEATDPSQWHPAASFAVVFAQRPADGGGWERRLEVERTEVEPEQEGRTWPDWDCRDICGWMREQLGLAGEPLVEREPGPAKPAAPQEPAAAARAAPARGPGGLAIGGVVLIDPGAQVGPMAPGVPPVEVVTPRPVAEVPPAPPPGPLRVEITVTGARRGQEVHAVARVLPRGETGWNAQAPAVIKGPGTASFDLSGLPPGRHDVALIAWAPDGSMRPAAVTLPGLTIQPPAQPAERSP